MLEILDDFVRYRIDAATLERIQRLNTGRLKLVLALDEMGQYRAAVRAICANPSVALRKTLGFGSNVSVQLIVAGTGVGQGAPAGSSTFSYNYVVAKDDKLNYEIFRNYAFESTAPDMNIIKQTLSRGRNKVIREVLVSNSRMAATLGSAVHTPLSKVSSVEQRLKFLDELDLLPFLTQAAFKYKTLNSLEFVTLDTARELAIRSVRMHMFPTAPTVSKSQMQNRYGLVVDTSRFGTSLDLGEIDLGIDDTDDKLQVHKYIDGYSRYYLPSFTTVTLALMTNLTCVTKSLSNGSSLEAYWHGTSSLLACASASDTLFRKLLEVAHTTRKGAIEPLNYTVGKDRDGADVTCDPLDGDTFSETVVVSIEADFSNQRMSREEFLAEFTGVLMDLKAKMTDAEGRYKGVHICPIVSIRSPDQFSFADSMILIDNTIFLFQMKDISTHRETGGR
eukprot:GILJ01021549.1.p1 GENE.GILJ01021549.1~~GILJ01021549.1.p1  ORF type:complete len:449 (-),score=49.79 GILJ01021549.1:215-1561(-)